MRCMMILAAAILFVATFGQAASGADDSDETKIRGTWQLVSKTHKGVETKIDAQGDDQQVVFTCEEFSGERNSISHAGYSMLARPSTLRSAVVAISPNCRGGICQICGFINSTATWPV